MDTNLVQEEFIPWSAHSDVLPGLETFYNFYMVLIRFKNYALRLKSITSNTLRDLR